MRAVLHRPTLQTSDGFDRENIQIARAAFPPITQKNSNGANALDVLSEQLTSLPGELNPIRIGIANRPTQLSCSASKTGLPDTCRGLVMNG